MELLKQFTRQLLEAAHKQTHVHEAQVSSAVAADLLLLSSSPSQPVKPADANRHDRSTPPSSRRSLAKQLDDADDAPAPLPATKPLPARPTSRSSRALTFSQAPSNTDSDRQLSSLGCNRACYVSRHQLMVLVRR